MDWHLWWKKDDVESPKKKLEFVGDPTAMSKSWPFIWRYGQDQHCLEVLGDYEDGYRLFFSSITVQMRFRESLTARYVWVREGREPVAFWTENEYGDHLPLAKTGRMIPAKLWKRPDRSSPDAPTFAYLRDTGTMVWV